MIKCDKIVIGSSHKAVKFAVQNSLPIIRTKPLPIFFFDHTKEEERSEMLYWHSLKGLVSTLSDFNPSIKIEDNLISFHDGKSAKEFEFNHCFVFDYVQIISDQFQVLETELLCNKVVDWLKVRTGIYNEEGLIEEDLVFEDDSRVINKIFLHSTSRDNHNKNGKDIAILSYLEDSELNDADLEGSIFRLTVLAKLKEEGYRTDRFATVYNGRKYYKPIKLEHMHRDVVKIQKHKVETGKRITFENSYYKEVLNGKTIL